jgi:4'-phosphopantetheinyl transferase
VTNATGWTPSVVPPDLEPGEVHVWLLDLDRAREEGLALLLAPDERQRTARFIRERDRHRFLVARGTVRTLLGRYLGRDPAALVFVYGDEGKPALEDGAVAFNVSHSDGLGMLAFARDLEVGVDVEQRRPLAQVMPVARRFFRPEEVVALEGVTEARRAIAFAAAWSAKEAWVKARGLGIPSKLGECPVRIEPDGTVRAEGVEPLAVDPGHAGALAVVGEWSGTIRRLAPGG